LFLKDDGTVWACGNNGRGQLGDGSNTTRTTPVPIEISGVKAISAGYSFSFFLKTDGTVWACGDNNVSRLGDGTSIDRVYPVQVQISDVSAISAGVWHSLFLKNNGSVWASGTNYFRQFGNGTNLSQTTPIQVTDGALAISASGNGTDAMSLVVKANGTVWGAGTNVWGQLGVGTSGNSYSSFTQAQITGVGSVTGYGNHSRFLKSDGTVWAAGSKGTHFGIASGVSSYSVPVQVQEDVMQVAVGFEHCLYLKKNGSVVAAGANNDGQLGDGTDSTRILPVAIMSLARMLNASATTGGTVSGSGAYEPDATATVTATPALGYLFGGWQGDATGTVNPLSLVMDASKTLVAKFNRNTSDTDDDGVDFYDEVVTYGTNPEVADTDGDGFKDGFEVGTGFNPAVATSSPDALSSIRTAVEFRFNAADWVSYRIEASTDLETWETVEAVIIGQGGVVTRFYSTENLPKRYFRVRRN
jgi:hypothetical protein